MRTADPIAANQSKYVDRDGNLRYRADDSLVFPGATGVREPRCGHGVPIYGVDCDACDQGNAEADLLR